MDIVTWIRAQWDRVLAWALVGLGVLCLLLGWLGVSSTAYIAEQVPYIVSAGLFGVFLLGLGATVWLSADLRDEWRKLDRIEAALTAADATYPDGEPATARGRARARAGSTG
jgi:hypothetical protein